MASSETSTPNAYDSAPMMESSSSIQMQDQVARNNSLRRTRQSEGHFTEELPVRLGAFTFHNISSLESNKFIDPYKPIGSVDNKAVGGQPAQPTQPTPSTQLPQPTQPMDRINIPNKIISLRGTQTEERLTALAQLFGPDTDILQHHVLTQGILRKSRPSKHDHYITIRFISIGVFPNRNHRLPLAADYKTEKKLQIKLASQLVQHRQACQEKGWEDVACYRNMTLHNDSTFTVEQQVTLLAPYSSSYDWSGVMLSDFGTYNAKKLGDYPWEKAAEGDQTARFLSPYTTNLEGFKLPHRPDPWRSKMFGKSEEKLVFLQDFFVFAGDLLQTSSACWGHALGFLRHTLDNLPEDPKVQILRISRATEVLDRADRFFAAVNRFLRAKTQETEHIINTHQKHGAYQEEANRTEWIDKRESLMKILASEFEFLATEATELNTWCRNAHATALSQVNIQMAQQGLVQGERIRTITFLAFFFVPVTLVSSLFGMNIKELSEGKEPEIWLYFVCAAVATSLTILGGIVVLYWRYIVEEVKKQLQSESVSPTLQDPNTQDTPAGRTTW
ncbi:hypothetical protein F5X68DRAFT_227434 [Plectosphaerella plurivora]|uniref:Uncharacterized protein n=1 Tax=Plectosphaerella plurivora TaxID=936078 RepID=A0A9P8VKS1_9PEZI|nr:hypothetical protein F5X68DRAFT_227434 [Plectosphaerella plurivora]